MTRQLMALALSLFAGTALAQDDTLGVAADAARPAQLQDRHVSPWAFHNDGRKGVVSVSHPLAAEAGARILERGGNAIDAAAAIQFALNVVEPQFSGIGGGGFMMVHIAKTGETHIVDSRERAPAAATPDMFAPGGVPFSFGVASTSGFSVGVPGTLLGVDTALKRWGTKSLRETLRPAIKLAEDGFRINRFLAADIANNALRTGTQPETGAIFRPGGVPLAEGALLKQPDLAKTFKWVARHGVDVFYRGPIAEAIVDAQKRSTTPILEQGVGRMTLADLRQYQVAIRDPIVGRYRGFTLASMPPPSSGGLSVLQMLQMLERYPIGNDGLGFGFADTKTWHVMIESMRLAYADRAKWMGDEDFVHVPKRGLLNPMYVDSRAGLINLGSRMPLVEAGDPLPFDMAALDDRPAKLAATPLDPEKGVHTTHFSVVDRRGNVVSYTSTIENTWGTGITVPGWGFLLNNELTDFNFVPAFDPSTGNPGANDVAPFKRPRSSMTPSMLFKRGEPIAAYGSPGGSTIINSVLNITLNLIDHGMTIQQAINSPRLSVTSALGTVSCEGGQPFMVPPVPASTFAGLQALDHLMPAAGTCASTIGSVQAVVIDLRTGKRAGGADPRREGTVISLPRGRPWWWHDED